VPLFRSRSHFRVPTLKLGPVITVVAVLLVIGIIALLALIDPRPSQHHFEVPVGNERLSH